ncbi:MAG: polyprenyl diphosphate synthase, partial [Nitrosomonadales bacterium]|nr:polyprenyl diphosphate synthase [Nitrosomonadales bacterium]
MALFSSSTKSIPGTSQIPRHVAVIMDGNGRWAKKRFLPRVAGHKRGVEAVRDMVRSCATLGVEFLTLFAFSSENWRRPQEEVSFLMGLFMEALGKEVNKLHQNNIRMVVIGDRSQFDASLRARIDEAELLTKDNKGLTLTIAANYGGRWDLVQGFNKLAAQPAGSPDGYTEDDLAQHLSMHYAPEPDLFIRTGG